MSRTILDAAGTYVLAPAGTGLGDAGYQVILSPKESWVGTVTLKTNTAPPGATPVYVSVAYQNATSGEEVAAGTALTAGAAVIVSPPAGDLAAVYTQSAGVLVINVNPATRGVTNSELATAFAAAGYSTAGQDTPVGMLSAAVAKMLAAPVSLGGNTQNPANNIYSVAIGLQALEDNTSGQSNVAVGYQNLKENTIGSGNTAIGTTALIFNTTGSYNTGCGVDALYTNVGGYSNSAFGADALGFNIDGRENCAVGFDSLFKNTYGNHSTAIGFKSLFENLTGSRNVAIGCGAGYWETGSGNFYLDSMDSASFRANVAADRAGALMYGTFNATASSQTLKVNAVVTVTYGMFSGQYAALFGAKSGTNQIAQFSTNDGTLGSTGMKITITNNTTNSMQVQANQEGTGYTALDLNPAGGQVSIASSGVASSVLGSLVVAQAFACNGATVRTSHASGGALNAYGAGANGFDTGANASALHAMVVAIRLALVNNGIMS